MEFLPETDPRRVVWAKCESPIEQYICVGLFVTLGCRAVLGDYDHAHRRDLAAVAGDVPSAFVFGQQPIGHYRADLAVVLIDPVKRISRRFVIECDGAAYHSSEEQRARDSARDADIKAAGYRFVLRFSGRDIHRHFNDVLADVERYMRAFGIDPKSPNDCGWYADMLEMASRSIVDERAARRQERERIWREWDEEATRERAAIEDPEPL